MGFLHADDVPFHEPPGHLRGYSKYLVDPDLGSRYFDFRLSRYVPGGLVEPHEHTVAEHVYYFIEGTGSAECGDDTRTVGAGTVMFVPPGVRHSVACTGDVDLVFIVATSPPGDIPR
jgi:mannose-6-phosphate isomerase-like protein (cupin superfamily)